MLPPRAIAALALTIAVGLPEQSAGAQSPRPGDVIAADRLDGASAPSAAAWRRAPATFADAPGGGRAFRCERGATVDPASLPWMGDWTWTTYRVEVDVLPLKNWAGIDFHVGEDGTSAASVTVLPVPGGRLAFEAATLFGRVFAWKPWPAGQTTVPHGDGRWVRLRLDVGATTANVYVDDGAAPVATFRDLPGRPGGVRLMTYAGVALFRNLRVTALPPGEVQPQLDDPWAAARQGHVLVDWEMTPPREVGYSPNGLPREVRDGTGPWMRAPVDARGVVHLTDVVGDRNAAGVTFARTTIRAAAAGVRRLRVTYTDGLTIWCNGRQVFAGPPRQWFHPDREKHGNSRLIPDQYEVEVPLRAGRNQVVLRSEVTEPFGWAFWVRLVEP